MKPSVIPVHLAKQLIAEAQYLDNNHQLPPGKAGIVSVIKNLGYVQIDTIAVIQRAHHHVLWTRCEGYREHMLDELHAVERQIFEYWTHAMSYLPMSEYRYALPKMQNFTNPRSPWAQYQLGKCQDLLEPVLKRIRDEGPLSASDFKPPPGKSAGGWWDWKPAKVALELLFWRGDLMIRERQNFQKIYDLTERVLPAEVNTTMPTPEEMADYLVWQAITALGVAEEGEIQRFMQPQSSRDADLHIVNKTQIRDALQRLVEQHMVTVIKIKEIKNKIYYVKPVKLENFAGGTKIYPVIKFLSPFDNMIIQRDRIKRFYGFDYALECYLPVPKRRYGYFSLPILWGNEFVGRLDPRADGKNRELTINNLIFEPGFEVNDEFLLSFKEAVINFAGFNQCERIHLENVSPKKFKSKIVL
ncbi:MAG: YcaQ family DNA glycosylase [bacterium]|nr:MAG: YcaQ family DNA glycosylase [bacterium]